MNNNKKVLCLDKIIKIYKTNNKKNTYFRWCVT